MYLDYWKITKYPFENVPDPDFMYYSPEHEEALVSMLYAVKRMKGAALLTGDIGSGKTTLSRVFIQQLPEKEFDIGLITNPSLNALDFIKEVHYQLGIDSTTNSKTELLVILDNHLLDNMNKGRSTLLIIDEAQLIFGETFEEMRLLLNFQMNDRFLMTFLLIGQPELREMIREYKQLDQRIAIRYHLNPLPSVETRNYIRFRLSKTGCDRELFTKEAYDAIYQYSGGIPRKINNVCDLALLIGFSLKVTEIDEHLILKVVRESL